MVPFILIITPPLLYKYRNLVTVTVLLQFLSLIPLILSIKISVKPILIILKVVEVIKFTRGIL